MGVAIVVVIVTRNRAEIVRRCLQSLLSQTLVPTQVVVVDNNSSDHTAAVIRSVAQQGLPVRRVMESHVGYPYVYNQGLQQAKKADWVCFIDDDCIADEVWYAELVKGVTRHPTAAAVMGASQTLHTHSLWSLATWSFDQMWKQTAMADHDLKTGDKKIRDLEVLDNKNIAYNQQFLQLHSIRFNEQALLVDGVGAAEDADLGMQISSHHGTAWFLPKAVVTHMDPNSCGWFLKKIIASARAVRLYRARWSKWRGGGSRSSQHSPSLSKPTKPRLRLLRQWLHTSDHYQLSVLKRIGLLLVMILGASIFTLVYSQSSSKK